MGMSGESEQTHPSGNPLRKRMKTNRLNKENGRPAVNIISVSSPYILFIRYIVNHYIICRIFINFFKHIYQARGVIVFSVG